jgi:hypothetical protein
MKSIILILIFLVSTLWAQTSDFFDNPASIAPRDYSTCLIPLISFDGDVSNSLLRLDDLNIFQKDNLLSANEKKLLIADDLSVNLGVNMKIADYGYNNWNLDFSLYSHSSVNILDNEFSKIILYGNETNQHYLCKSGDESISYTFGKIKLQYAHPKFVDYALVLNGVHIASLYFGANINLNYPLFYGEVLESTQSFGSMLDSLYYDATLKLSYFELGESSVSPSPSFGFGAILELQKGWAYFKVDDIFGNLKFENLKAFEYREQYSNELIYFDEDYEITQESIENEYRISARKISFHPSLEFGFEHEIFKNTDILAKYKLIQYETRNGLSVGANYDFMKIIPIQVVCGYADHLFYEAKLGLKLRKFEWSISSNFYHGFFRYAKGMGVSSEMRINF